MAITAIAAQLTELHRLAQLRLGAQTVAQLRSAWGLLDPEDLDATFEGWLRVAVPVVQANRAMSSSLAAGYVQAFRRAELAGAAGPFRSVLAAPVDVKMVTTSLLVTGPWSVKTAMSNGIDLARAADIAEARSSAAGMRHALDGGRDTIVDSVAADRQALGWARVASGNACAFCAMLASRGPTYSEASADFEAHDGCQCGAEPVYSTNAAWPANSQRYRDLWNEHTAGASGADALNAFRQALAST